MDDRSVEQLLSCLVKVIGRATMPPERVAELVGNGRSNLKAYNMCDGVASQGDIARKLRIDQGQLSKTVSRWVEAGIVFRMGAGEDSRPLHIYPVQSSKKRAPARKKRKR